VVVTEDDPPLDTSRYDVMQGVSGIYAGFTRHVVKAPYGLFARSFLEIRSYRRDGLQPCTVLSGDISMNFDSYDPVIFESEFHDPYRSAVNGIGIQGNPGIGSRILSDSLNKEEEILGKLYRLLVCPLVL